MIKKYKGFTPEIDETCFIAEGSQVIGDVEIGRQASVWYNAVIRGDMAKIIIGENSNIQDGSVVHCIIGKETVVGNNVTVGHGAILHSCTIKDGSLIGMGSIVLDGAVVGKNCIIGAGTVITPNTIIPDGSLVLGSPGKVKRPLTEEDIAHIRRGVEEYIRLAQEHKIEE